MAKGRQKTTPAIKGISKPSKGRQQTEKEKVALATIVCNLYETDSHTLDYCLAQAGINSRTTWLNWTRDIEQIEQLYTEAKKRKAKSYKELNTERARTALERALEGFEKLVEEREGYYKRDPETSELILDDKGQPIFIETKIKRKVIYIPPKLGAIFYALNNMDKSNFERNPDGETDKKARGAFDEWTDEQIQKELERLR